MNTAPRMPETSSEIPAQAVSVYGQADAYEDFPVLKAFQQYVDAEQSKARRRMLMLCVFFSVLMVVVIAVFLILLLNVGRQNQALNDRLVEYAMKERERAAAPIVVQPQQQQQDNATILAITAKMDEMRKSFDESRKQAAEAEARRKAAEKAEKAELAAKSALEIKRLNERLAAQKAEFEKQQSELRKLAEEKARHEAEKEKERLRQIELEKYRRKHYPEFYEKKERKNAPVEIKDEDHAELMREVDEILDEDEAVTYFNEEKPVAPSRTRPSAPAATLAPAATPVPVPKEYAIPVDIRGSRSRWNIPND